MRTSQMLLHRILNNVKAGDVLTLPDFNGRLSSHCGDIVVRDTLDNTPAVYRLGGFVPQSPTKGCPLTWSVIDIGLITKETDLSDEEELLVLFEDRVTAILNRLPSATEWTGVSDSDIAKCVRFSVGMYLIKSALSESRVDNKGMMVIPAPLNVRLGLQASSVAAGSGSVAITTVAAARINKGLSLCGCKDKLSAKKSSLIVPYYALPGVIGALSVVPSTGDPFVCPVLSTRVQMTNVTRVAHFTHTMLASCMHEAIGDRASCSIQEMSKAHARISTAADAVDLKGLPAIVHRKFYESACAGLSDYVDAAALQDVGITTMFCFDGSVSAEKAIAWDSAAIMRVRDHLASGRPLGIEEKTILTLVKGSRVGLVSLIDFCRLNHYADAAEFISDLLTEEPVFESSKFEIAQSTAGYKMTTLSTGESKMLTNFAIFPVHRVMFMSAQPSIHCEVYIDGQKLMMVLPSPAFETVNKLAKAINEQVFFKSVGVLICSANVYYPSDANFVIAYLRRKMFSLDLVKGVTKLGWDEAFSSYSTPFCIVTQAGAAHRKGIPDPSVRLLSTFNYDAAPPDTLPAPVLTDKSKALLEGVASIIAAPKLLGKEANHAVPVSKDTYVLIRTLFTILGQPSPLFMNDRTKLGNQDKYTCGYPIWGEFSIPSDSDAGALGCVHVVKSDTAESVTYTQDELTEVARSIATLITMLPQDLMNNPSYVGITPAEDGFGKAVLDVFYSGM